MFGPKLKITNLLLEKLRLASEQVGAASVEEFAARILEEGADGVLQKVAAKQGGKASAKDVSDITEKLKGLGYLE